MLSLGAGIAKPWFSYSMLVILLGALGGMAMSGIVRFVCRCCRYWV
ncbi:hypothetical protein O9993_00110 [Vibrio lentus]|nr:hypothetical protein [Vibrio lentus]